MNGVPVMPPWWMPREIVVTRIIPTRLSWQQSTFACQTVRALWSHDDLATRLGQKLGGCHVLLGPLPPRIVAKLL